MEVNSPSSIFNSVPKIGFKYGPEEFICTTDRSLAIDDEVIWTISNAENPLIGRIEFLGRQKEQRSNAKKSSLAAVVIFDQPTCHLPKHLTNPPCNRNLVPADQLIKKGEGQWQLKPEQDIQLIGNCIAKVYQQFENSTMPDFSAGDLILVYDKTSIINGKILITGNIKEKSEGNASIISCVGVKFDKSVNSCANIELRHLNGDNRCKMCAGGTLAFVPLTFFSYMKKNENKVLNTESPEKTGEKAPANCNNKRQQSELSGKVKPLPVAEPEKENKRSPTSKRVQKSTSIFVGNCVAVSKGTERKSVTGIRIGDRLFARKANKTLLGCVRVTCTIKEFELENVPKESCYVGVQFRSSFVDLCQSEEAVQHHDLRGKPATACKRCEGGKLVFIPVDYILSPKKIPVGDIVFEVGAK